VTKETKPATAEQQEIEGFRPKKIVEVERAFKTWLDSQSEWAIAKKTVNDKKEKLHDLMKAHKVPMYSFRGYTAKLEEEEKITISKTPKEVAGEDAEETDTDKE